MLQRVATAQETAAAQWNGLSLGKYELPEGHLVNTAPMLQKVQLCKWACTSPTPSPSPSLSPIPSLSASLSSSASLSLSLVPVPVPVPVSVPVPVPAQQQHSTPH